MCVYLVITQFFSRALITYTVSMYVSVPLSLYLPLYPGQPDIGSCVSLSPRYRILLFPAQCLFLGPENASDMGAGYISGCSTN